MGKVVLPIRIWRVFRSGAREGKVNCQLSIVYLLYSSSDERVKTIDCG